MAPDQLFELRRRTFDTPQFRGIEFIEVEAKSIVNPVPGNYLPFNWTINPYRGCSHACTFCFARVTHTYMDMNAGKDFESNIVVKVNAPELLRAKLRSKAWKGEHIAMGTPIDAGGSAAARSTPPTVPGHRVHRGRRLRLRFCAPQTPNSSDSEKHSARIA